LTLKGGSYREAKGENGGGIMTVRNILGVIFAATYLAIIAAQACTTGKESVGGKVFADRVCDGGKDGDKESKSGESEGVEMHYLYSKFINVSNIGCCVWRGLFLENKPEVVLIFIWGISCHVSETTLLVRKRQ
jgi:hypothetical protein